MEYKMPLEGDVVPLEDCEESDKSIISATLVGKIICEKAFNKVVKTIISKAWGCPKSLSIVDLGVNRFMFNFKDEALLRKIMEESP